MMSAPRLYFDITCFNRSSLNAKTNSSSMPKVVACAEDFVSALYGEMADFVLFDLGRLEAVDPLRECLSVALRSDARLPWEVERAGLSIFMGH